MYKAEITDKGFDNGMLSVVVKFTNEEGKQVEETFQTNQSQNDEWLTERVTSKLKHLNALEEKAKNIVISTKFEDVEVVAEGKAERDEFLNDYQKLSTINRLISLGILTEDYEEKAELVAKLKTNFKPEYLGII